MMERGPVAAAAVLALFLVAAAFAAEELPVGAAGELVVVTATIEKIDIAGRKVTLKWEDGRLETIRVGPDAKNLEPLRAGDRVTLKYYEAVAIFISRMSGPPSYAEVTSVEHAPPGRMPSSVATSVVEASVTIESLDLKKRTAAIRGPGGTVRNIRVDDRVRLSEFKAGDLVRIYYQEALAVSVDIP